MSISRDVYQEYTALAPIWQDVFRTDQTFLALLGGSSEQDLEPALKRRLGESVLSKAVDLQVAIQQIRAQRQGPWNKPLYLDVYDLALNMQIYPKSQDDHESWYYRGQRRG